MFLGARKLYWIAQLVGWTGYLVLALLLSWTLQQELGGSEFVALFLVWSIGLLISHLFRKAIVAFDWMRLRIASIIPRLLFGSLLSAILFEAIYLGMLFLLSRNASIFTLGSIIQDVLNWMLLFILWSLIYFFYHFFKNYKQEEIKNLQLEKAHQEFQINRLRSQLNPHFIFNAMNSIRALVDEDPVKAKKAITQLSNVLRNSLLMDEKKLIPMEDEIAIVKDYLEIEKARYEHRLNVHWSIDKHNESRMIPPLMLQTLVENAIKHGISKLPKGGDLNIELHCVPEGCEIEVSNSGSLNSEPSVNGTGYGVSSTKKRLDLLYEERASFELFQNKDQVTAKVFIPKDSKYIKQ
jgi:two-component system LytT family sensor kinase